MINKSMSYILLSCCAMMFVCCGKSTSEAGDAEDSLSIATPEGEIKMAEVKVMKNGTYEKTYNVADIDDKAVEYKTAVNKANCFFVVSKKEYRLYVYEVTGKDTALVAHYPVCYAKNTADKTGDGDCCTPESPLDKPFTISQIVDATIWNHDFGWGMIPAYGNYFMRLDIASSKVPANHSIGIHGSTNNAESVPGRDSEGCIRLRDADIIKLHDNYAEVGTRVFVKSFKTGKLPYEVKAENALGGKYQAPKPGNPYVKGKVSGEGDEALDYPQGKIEK